MQKKFIKLFLVFLLSNVMINSSYAGLPIADSQGTKLPTLAPMLKRVTPAVVNIATIGYVQQQRANPLLQDPFFQHFFGAPSQPQQRETQSLGSGVVIDAEQGLILTNNHVIDNAAKIQVTLRDGRQLEASLVGTDPDSDIAVIKVKAKNLTAVKIANSNQLNVGDFVVAIGNPFGLGQTVTSGIVSALGRSGLGIEGFEDFIQTDASINPGNSGGALVNLRGELVGINTAILSKSGGNIGIGFAIPINMVIDIKEQLLSHGAVQRGRLGAQAQDLSPQLAQAFGIPPMQQGAVVTSVAPDSAADKAGLKPGDIITKINHKQVKNTNLLRNAIGLLRIGRTVTLDIIRDGNQKTLTAKIEKPIATTLNGKDLHAKLSGSILGNIDHNSPLYRRIEGVVFNEVKSGSPARAAGLRRGDIIVSANRAPISNISELMDIASRSNELLLNLRRGNGALFLYLQP
ncbi:HtrA protease/chaperone protein / Serine protease (Protease DO) [hydrothermal vent metagenome]|uniref:HtrA protease/chaperone protein / Serine protease (Protease DO) n=1 Tax=hydrothermal vent metagenome TaxID=652676 RepID=A0A3B0ZXW3_9ZZZZ